MALTQSLDPVHASRGTNLLSRHDSLLLENTQAILFEDSSNWIAVEPPLLKHDECGKVAG